MKKTLVFIGLLFFVGASVWALSTYQNAIYVLGKPTMTSPYNDTPSATNLAQPIDAIFDGSNPSKPRLFISDGDAGRVLIYDLSSGISNGMAAANVLGKPHFATGFSFSAPTATELAQVNSLAWDPNGKRLFVSDQHNNRIMIYRLPHGGISNGMAAEHVLGASDFISALSFNESSPSAPDASTLRRPVGLAYDPKTGYLFVASWFDNRVLIYDVGPALVDGAPAIAVWGQPDMFSRGSGSGANGMNGPGDMVVDEDGRKLYVSDGGNHRILVFDLPVNPSATPPANGMAASNVLGQINFTDHASGYTQSTYQFVGGLEFDPVGKKLFVADFKRILIYELAGGITNGMNASLILGQPDFTSNAWTAVTARSISRANGMAYNPAKDQLFATEASFTNRVLVFTPPACGTLAICGRISATESSATNLPGVLVELRDRKGKLLATKKSNGLGEYRFEASDGLIGGESYFANPVVGRTQTASPLQAAAPNIEGNGVVNNFQIAGWPGALNVTHSAPGSLVVISTFNYTGTGTENPPPMNLAGQSAYFNSTTTGYDGLSTLRLAMGSYYLTCWRAERAEGSANVTFVRSPATGSNGPYTITPDQNVTVSCQPVQ